MSVLKDTYTALRDTIDDNTTLKPAKQLFDAKNIPDTAVEKTFCVTMQTANTNKYRDRTNMRLGHDVRVNFLVRVNPHAELTTYEAALDFEEEIIDALLVQSRNEGLRILYRSTDRVSVPSREYLVITIRFDIEGDYAVTS